MSTNAYLHLPQEIALFAPLSVNSHQSVEVKKGPAVFTCQRQRFSTLSSSQLSYNINLSDPSKNLISKFMYNEITATITVGATGLGSQTVKNYLLNAFALRQYPVASVTNTCQLFINEQSTSCQPSQWIHPLSWSQSFISNDAIDESITPVLPDMAQNYNDADNSMLNVLNGYYAGGVFFDYPRGVFNSDFVDVVNTSSTWQFTVVLREPIIHPLLAYSWNRQGRALAYVANFNITLNFLGNLSRMFSVNPDKTAITSIATTFNDANLVMYWMMVPTIQILPELVSYSFNTLISNQTAGPLPIAPNATTILVSQGYSWNQIPKRIYIYVGNQATDVVNGYNLSDSWFEIHQVIITFNTKTSLMANLRSADLYTTTMAGSGSRMSYMQSKYFVGAVLEIDPVIHLQLEADVTSGCLGSFNFQVDVHCKNPNQSLTIQPNLWVIQSNDTVMQTSNAYITSFIQGFIKSSDVIAANSSPAVPMSFNSSNMFGGGIGGTVWEDIKNFFSKAFNFAKENQLVSRGLSLVPGPVGLVGAPIARAFGLGNDYGQYTGSGLASTSNGQYGYGGRHMTKAQLIQQQMGQQMAARYGRGH
jgi:hypothetical protein